MARYTDSVCKQCRREGVKLFLKGDRCYSAKCAVIKRNTPPGQHGQARQRKPKEYGTQLREKQKVRRAYGVGEKQFRKYYDMASNMRGVTGENMLSLLERRLDNVVYRLGFASSRDEAKQLISHRHLTVNGRVVNIASYQVREGDTVAVKPRSRSIQPVQIAVNSAGSRSQPDWLEANFTDMTGRVVGMPTRDQIDTDVNEQLIVEFYSR